MTNLAIVISIIKLKATTNENSHGYTLNKGWNKHNLLEMDCATARNNIAAV